MILYKGLIRLRIYIEDDRSQVFYYWERELQIPSHKIHNYKDKKDNSTVDKFDKPHLNGVIKVNITSKRTEIVS